LDWDWDLDLGSPQGSESALVLQAKVSELDSDVVADLDFHLASESELDSGSRQELGRATGSAQASRPGSLLRCRSLLE
jgi:hypothetical protein